MEAQHTAHNSTSEGRQQPHTLTSPVMFTSNQHSGRGTAQRGDPPTEASESYSVREAARSPASDEKGSESSEGSDHRANSLAHGHHPAASSLPLAAQQKSLTRGLGLDLIMDADERGGAEDTQQQRPPSPRFVFDIVFGGGGGVGGYACAQCS